MDRLKGKLVAIHAIGSGDGLHNWRNSYIKNVTGEKCFNCGYTGMTTYIENIGCSDCGAKPTIQYFYACTNCNRMSPDDDEHSCYANDCETCNGLGYRISSVNCEHGYNSIHQYCAHGHTSQHE